MSYSAGQVQVQLLLRSAPVSAAEQEDIGLYLTQTVLLYSTWTLVEAERVGGYHRPFPSVSVSLAMEAKQKFFGQSVKAEAKTRCIECSSEFLT